MLTGLDTTLSRMLREAVTKEIETKTGFVLSGYDDHSRYREAIGEIRGMTTTLNIMDELIKKVMDER